MNWKQLSVVGGIVIALLGIVVAAWIGRYEPVRVTIDEGATGGFYVYVWDRWEHRPCRHYFGSDGATTSVGFQCFTQGIQDVVQPSETLR